MTRLEKLLRVASAALAPQADPPADRSIPKPLAELLAIRNGFYAFESALLVRPWGGAGPPLGLERWNDPTIWLDTYGIPLPSLFFFAEDVFGGQFAFSERGIVSFDPETGDTEAIAPTLEEWADRILDDYAFLTGQPAAHDWQRAHGTLRPGMRLIPRRLFVLGGEYKAANLVARDEVFGMRARGGFATRLSGVPDGTMITFEWTD